MRLSACIQSPVDGAELCYASPRVYCHEETITLRGLSRGSISQGGKANYLCQGSGMRFMLGLQSVAQKRYCEHEPFIIFGRGAQQRCIPHEQLGGTHLEWPSV